MRPVVLPVVASLLAAGVLTASSAQAGTPVQDQVRAHLRDLAADTGVPGMAWAVVEGDAVRTGTLGSDGDGRAVSAETPFLWGSVAKPVTAIAVMQLVEAGRIALDDPVVEHVPWLPVHEQNRTEVTVRQLLTHTSGFSTAAGLHLADRERAGSDAIREATADLDADALVAEPGGEHRYSAINFLVLGALVEEVTGRTFADHLDRRVLTPAGMAHAVTTAEQAEDNLSPGHRLALGRAWSFEGPYDGAGVPFGYLGGSVTDAAALVRTLLGDARGGRTRLLGRNALEAMWRPEVAAAGTSYALGWRTDTTPDGRLVWHSGATPSYFATVLMAPDDDLGVVVLANGYSVARDAQLNEAAFDLLRLVRGLDPAPVGPDRWLLLAPWLLIAVALLPVGLALVRTRRAPSLSAGGLAGWWLALAALACAARIGLPTATGQEWRTVSLWTPGVATGVRAVLVGCLLAAAVTLVRFSRTSRRPVEAS